MLFEPKYVNKFHTMYVKTDTCWLWQRSCITAGYGYFTVIHTVDGVKRRSMNAHRYSYMLHNNISQLRKDQLICHTCDNPKCVNPSHLYLGTYTDNVRDCESRNRANHVNGEQHGRVKLTAETVLAIRRAYEAGNTTHVKLAKEYNTSSGNIADILSRRRWKHLA